MHAVSGARMSVSVLYSLSRKSEADLLGSQVRKCLQVLFRSDSDCLIAVLESMIPIQLNCVDTRTLSTNGGDHGPRVTHKPGSSTKHSIIEVR